jgi:hypothetical protein
VARDSDKPAKSGIVAARGEFGSAPKRFDERVLQDVGWVDQRSQCRWNATVDVIVKARRICVHRLLQIHCLGSYGRTRSAFIILGDTLDALH